MNIEDLVILAAMKCQMNPYDSNLIWSFYSQISGGSGFTEKQAILAQRILHRQKSKLNELLGQNIQPFLDNPTYRLARRTISSAKRITIIDHSEFSRAIKVEFPFNEKIVESIRKARPNLGSAAWSPDDKAWIFNLNEQSVVFLSELVNGYEFIPDEEFEGYMDQAKEIQENIEKYIPMVTCSGKIPKFVNVSDRVPQPTSEDLVSAMFLARKCGIHTWDETITDELSRQNVNPVVINFLNENPGTNFAINLEDNQFTDLTDIIHYLGPCLFIIPGGSELERTQRSLEFLNSAGVQSEEISVLFRLPNETGGEFNTFVKDKNLNNPITEKTKIVFVSGKIPKTIVDADIKFNCIVNFSIHSVHYTIREYVKNHHNVIHVLEKKQQRNINFANL